MGYEREQREARETAEVEGWSNPCRALGVGSLACGCPECVAAEEDSEEEEEGYDEPFDEVTWLEENSDRVDDWSEVFA